MRWKAFLQGFLMATDWHFERDDTLFNQIVRDYKRRKKLRAVYFRQRPNGTRRNANRWVDSIIAQDAEQMRKCHLVEKLPKPRVLSKHES